MHKILKKKAQNPRKELFRPIFPRIIEYEKPQGMKCDVPVRNLSNTVHFIK